MIAKQSANEDEVADTMPLPASRPVKRSFSIAGHKTSISLEAAFWEAFQELCRADGVSMAAQLADIDRQRGDAAGLSGTVRVWILQRYRTVGPSDAYESAVPDDASGHASDNKPRAGSSGLQD